MVASFFGDTSETLSKGQGLHVLPRIAKGFMRLVAPQRIWKKDYSRHVICSKASEYNTSNATDDSQSISNSVCLLPCICTLTCLFTSIATSHIIWVGPACQNAKQ